MVVNYLMQTLGSQRNKMWRPYVVSNKYGKRQAMRDTKLYNSKKKAISAMKKKNDMWMELNYTNEFAKSSNFEYGAVFETASHVGTAWACHRRGRTSGFAPTRAATSKRRGETSKGDCSTATTPIGRRSRRK